MTAKPVESYVWPITVYEFFMWHGMPESRAQSVCDALEVVGMTMGRALFGHSQERRVAEGLLIEAADATLEQLVASLPSNSKWPLIKDAI